MMKLTDLETKLTEAGLKEMYPIILTQALNQIALTDKDFFNVLSKKIMYSLKADPSLILESVIAHEEYLLYLKRNQAEIVKTMIEIITK